MARWKLTGKHYLNVPGTEWEYEETTATGRRHKGRLPVPRFLDPDDPQDQNRDGEVIVAYAGTDIRGDIVFVGLPTPEMEPLDAEATEISNNLRPGWEHPIESLPTLGQSIMPDPKPPAAARRI